MSKTETLKGFDIFQTQTIKFSFKDRIRILFGKAVKGQTTITVDKECDVIEGKHAIYVERIFPKKEIGEINSTENNPLN